MIKNRTAESLEHTLYILARRIGRQSGAKNSLIDVQKITKLVNKIKLNTYKKQIELSSICVFLV